MGVAGCRSQAWALGGAAPSLHLLTMVGLRTGMVVTMDGGKWCG